MKFALRYCNTGRYTDPAEAVALLQAGEAAGFESAWTIEHTVVPKGYRSSYPYAAGGRMPGDEAEFVMPDPLIWMSWAAAHTQRIRLGTAILILPQHNPVVTAKQVATLDAMSGGRIELGIGVGWLREEFDALGVPFEDRGARTDDYVHAMRELWRSPAPTYRGRFVSFENAFMRPKPVNGTVPITVGGHSKAAARRAGRLGDGFFPARGAPEDLFDLVRSTAREHGRDPDAITLTCSIPDDLNELPRLAAMGVGRVTVPVTGVAGLAMRVDGPEDLMAWKDTIERYADL